MQGWQGATLHKKASSGEVRGRRETEVCSTQVVILSHRVSLVFTVSSYKLTLCIEHMVDQECGLIGKDIIALCGITEG